MLMANTMLTTVDNPFDPHTQFESWNAWDIEQGYHTNAFLARLVQTSDELSDADHDLAIELAIDEAVEENVLGLYRKAIVKED